MADACRIQLESTLRKIAEDHGYPNCEMAITPTSTDGANYTSLLYLGTISTQDKADLKVFAKVALISPELRAMMPSNAFHAEQYVYSRVRDVFEKIQDKFEVAPEDRLAFPKMYGYNATELEEVVVLQDLGAEGYATLDRRQPFEWPYAAAVVQQLARLHALSIATQHHYPTEYQEIVETLKIGESVMKMIFQFTEQSVMKYIDLIKEDNRELVRKFMENKYAKLINGLLNSRCHKVFVHGDFRSSNIMHKIDENGKLHAVILDYQTMSVGSPVTDLLYLIFSGSDAEFRRRYFEPLLDHYYDQLTLALARFQLQAPKILPRHEFDREMNQHFAIGLMNAFLALPMMTMQSEDAPAMDGSFTLDAMLDVRVSPLLAQRLNEIVDDYISWGIL